MNYVTRDMTTLDRQSFVERMAHGKSARPAQRTNLTLSDANAIADALASVIEQSNARLAALETHGEHVNRHVGKLWSHTLAASCRQEPTTARGRTLVARCRAANAIAKAEALLSR